MTPFTYVVLRYVHDSATGESLNVGILLTDAEGTFVGYRLESHTGRLSGTFRGFDAASHRRSMRSLAAKVNRLREGARFGQRSLFPLGDAGKVVRTLWPDAGLSYRASEVKAGAALDLEHTLNGLFHRFVTSQEPDRRARRRRDDEDVWRDLHKRLPVEIALKLRPASVEAGPFTFRFDHAYRNGALHIVEPLSFDLVEPDSLRDKSMRWMGYALHLKPYVGTLSLVVEGPDRNEVRPAYRSALDVLRHSADVYEVDQTDRLTQRLERLIG